MGAQFNLFGLLRAVRRASIAVCLFGLAAAIGIAQEVVAEAEPTPVDTPVDPVARMIRIPLPIRGTVDTRVRRMLDQVLAELPDDAARSGKDRPTLVLEFWPPADGKGESSEFGRALDLARHLASSQTSGVRVVAWIPKTIRGHAVLVALACEQIVMHPDAQIGDAGVSESTIGPTLLLGYREIADRRRTIPPAVALGMLNPDLEVQRVTTPTGQRFLLSDEVDEFRKTTTVQSIDTVIPAGDAGLLSGDKLRLDYGFVSHLANDRRELAAALGVSANDLDLDPSLGGEWNAVQIELHGPIDTISVDRVMRVVEDRLNGNSTNFILLSIDSAGGSLEESTRLATWLAELDSTKVRSVAWVENQAAAEASLVALACDQLVMQEDARIGGEGARSLGDNELRLATLAVREIAAKNQRNWSVPVAMLDEDLNVHRYRVADANLVEYFCDEELQQQNDPGRWEKLEEISAAGEVLELNGEEAGSLRIARHVVEGLDGLRQRYQLDDTPEVLKPNWAHELIGALATPQVAAGLLFIGFFAMIAEMSAPGLGIGGFIAACCFLLFFWSNFLQGTAGWLEVLLFFAGLIFIAMEVFVLPGFGIFGLGGIVMVFLSLVLASQTFVIPRTADQFEQLPRSMFTVVGAMGGVIVSVVFLRKYLDNSPLFQRFLLAPPEGAAAIELDRREAVVDYSHLMGQSGRTSTPLSPSGKAFFGDELIDVVSDGLAVDRGTMVRVVEVAGNRVVVREVE